MNSASNGQSFVYIKTGSGRKMKIRVRDFNRNGLGLAGSADMLNHNELVEVSFDYYLDNRLHFIKTNAIVDRKNPDNESLHFFVGSKAMDIVKRLSHEKNMLGGLRRFDREITSAYR